MAEVANHVARTAATDVARCPHEGSDTELDGATGPDGAASRSHRHQRRQQGDRSADKDQASPHPPDTTEATFASRDDDQHAPQTNENWCAETRPLLEVF